MQAKTQKAHRLTIKGQITVPKADRDALGWSPRTKVIFVRKDGGLLMLPETNKRDFGAEFVDRWEGKGNHRMTTNEIMAMTRGED